jgi:hypothetical protein
MILELPFALGSIVAVQDQSHCGRIHVQQDGITSNQRWIHHHPVPRKSESLSRFERPSSQQCSGPASEIRPRYRKSCTTSSSKGIWHLQHSRRVEDGHTTRSSSTIATRICFDITRILSTCCRRVYNGCIRRGVSLSLKALPSKRRRVAQMCAVVHVAELMATYSERCSGVCRCFPALLYPISLVKSSQSYKQVIFHRSVFLLC